MPLTLIATPGAANANTFVTVAEMTAYCEGRLNASVWTGAVAQEPALVEATRDLSVLGWRGEKADATQSLAWPRYNVPDPDPSRLNPVVYLDETTIPRLVKDATCELALQYLKAGTTDIAGPDAADGIKRKQVDVLETEYFEGAKATRGLSRYPRVLAHVAPLLTTGAGGLTVVRA